MNQSIATEVSTNQRIHEFLGKSITRPEKRCSGCDISHPYPGGTRPAKVPDYENDLNAVREAELKAIEVYGMEAYGKVLGYMLFPRGVEGFSPIATVATAPASVRCQAILRLLEGK